MLKKNVTEGDLEVTEARLRESFTGFKRSLLDIPSDMAKPVTDTVRNHPYASMAAAVAAGFLAFRLASLALLRTKVVARETGARTQAEVTERRKHSLVSRIVSGAVSMAEPYIVNYAKIEAARLLSGAIKGRPDESDKTRP